MADGAESDEEEKKAILAEENLLLLEETKKVGTLTSPLYTTCVFIK